MKSFRHLWVYWFFRSWSSIKTAGVEDVDMQLCSMFQSLNLFFCMNILLLKSNQESSNNQSYIYIILHNPNWHNAICIQLFLPRSLKSWKNFHICANLPNSPHVRENGVKSKSKAQIHWDPSEMKVRFCILQRLPSAGCHLTWIQWIQWIHPFLSWMARIRGGPRWCQRRRTCRKLRLANCNF